MFPTVLPGCHHSEVTPSTTSLNDIVQFRFMLQPILHPAKATAAPGPNPMQDCWTFLMLLESQGLILTAAAVSTCIISPLLSTHDLLPSLTRGTRWRQRPHSHSMYHGNVLRKQRGSEQCLSFQSRILSIS